MEIITIETKSLGDRSYVVIDANTAAVIDPQRDIDRPLAIVHRRFDVALVAPTWSVTPTPSRSPAPSSTRSAHLAESVPADASVDPTHGFGSFCSSSASSDVDARTIAQERHTNIACTTTGEDAFVEQFLAGLTACPRYYAHMAPYRQGPPPVDLSPPEPVDPLLDRAGRNVVAIHDDWGKTAETDLPLRKAS